MCNHTRPSGFSHYSSKILPLSIKLFSTHCAHSLHLKYKDTAKSLLQVFYLTGCSFISLVCATGWLASECPGEQKKKCQLCYHVLGEGELPGERQISVIYAKPGVPAVPSHCSVLVSSELPPKGKILSQPQLEANVWLYFKSTQNLSVITCIWVWKRIRVVWVL